jgi:hypothetical protein
MEGRWEVVHLLAEGARGEHLGDEVDVASRDVDPGGVELHDVAVLERLEEVDLAVEPLQVLGALQEVVQLHLVPGHFHPLELVERSVPASTRSATSGQREAKRKIADFGKERRILHGLGRALAENVVELHNRAEEPANRSADWQANGSRRFKVVDKLRWRWR